MLANDRGQVAPCTNDHREHRSGSVCLDVINQTWSPMYDMINIFEVFLPQLLRYPNPTDPLNGEAAALLMREPKSYDAKVKGNSALFAHYLFPLLDAELTDDSTTDYVQRYATKEAADDAGQESEDDEDMSSVASFDSDNDDDEPAGKMDEV